MGDATTPPPSDAALDVAAVAAEALRLLADLGAPCVHEYRPSPTWRCGRCSGCAADGAAQDALGDGALTFARHVVALAARVTAAEAAAAFATGERDAARSIAAGFREQCDLALAVAGEAQAARDAAEAQRAALAVARKAVVDASARYGAAWDAVLTMPPTAAQSEEIAAAMRVSYEAQDALSVALDALLRGAPGGYVRASVVRRYMHAAENSVDAGEMIEARGALVDALAAAGSACRSDDDGDCRWNRCPQRLDGEPWVTGRVCPLTKED